MAFLIYYRIGGLMHFYFNQKTERYVMSQRHLVYNQKEYTRIVVTTGWDRPLSQLFINAELQTFKRDEWLSLGEPIVETYIEVLPRDICDECMNQFRFILEDIHYAIELEVPSNDVLVSLNQHLKKDTTLDSSSFTKVHAIDGVLVKEEEEEEEK